MSCVLTTVLCRKMRRIAELSSAVGTPVGVQQKLMRHSDLRPTMNIYGNAAKADMREAHSKIVQMALRVE